MLIEIHRYIWLPNWFIGRWLKKGQTDRIAWILISLYKPGYNAIHSMLSQNWFGEKWMSEPSEVSCSQNQYLERDFFATSYSKVALAVASIQNLI